jgi:hypothetical protein
MIVPMKTKPQSEEYRSFENLLGKVITVTKSELNQRLESEKQAKAASPRVDKPARC